MATEVYNRGGVGADIKITFAAAGTSNWFDVSRFKHRNVIVSNPGLGTVDIEHSPDQSTVVSPPNFTTLLATAEAQDNSNSAYLRAKLTGGTTAVISIGLMP